MTRDYPRLPEMTRDDPRLPASDGHLRAGETPAETQPRWSRGGAEVEPCRRHVHDMSEACSRHVRGMPETCPRHVPQAGLRAFLRVTLRFSGTKMLPRFVVQSPHISSISPHLSSVSPHISPYLRQDASALRGAISPHLHTRCMSCTAYRTCTPRGRRRRRSPLRRATSAAPTPASSPGDWTCARAQTGAGSC